MMDKDPVDRLGIPPDAKQVIIFGESSHWDPDWLLTAERYYRLRIRSILSKAIKELKKDPRRVYSVECLYFLRMFWERNPHKRDDLRELLNQGRMRLTGSGITTPDTLLPSAEAIIRDYLCGQEWLRQNDIFQEPVLAHLPDDFGHSPCLPDLLSSMGFEYAGVSRIDGMYFPGSDYRPSRSFPRPGTSAYLLQNEVKSADFYWAGNDGSMILTHWNPFTYFQGDTLDTAGAAKWMGLRLGIPSRSPRKTAGRIEAFAKKLAPLARTRYMFCPIGCDFVDPIPDLPDILDSYNQERYPHTGLFAVNAGLDDYLMLVETGGAELPALKLDPNPYWMGFYASRPEMKKRCTRLSESLLQAETLLVSRDRDKPSFDARQSIRRGWETVAVSNHHDYITGTSPERVWKKEQKPWLEKAQKETDEFLATLRQGENQKHETREPDLPNWSLQDGRLEVETGYYLAELDEREGGTFTYLATRTPHAENIISGTGNDLVLYKDTGGLWRMGHEYRGGVFRELTRASGSTARLRAEEWEGALRVEVLSELDGQSIVRRMFFWNSSPLIVLEFEGAAPARSTICCRFSTALRTAGPDMDVPGGVFHRPLSRNYDPCFWSFQGFVHLRDHATGKGVALLSAMPGAVSADANGKLEWCLFRNTPKERAFGVLPVLAHPARGPDPHSHKLCFGIMATAEGDWLENRLPVTVRDFRNYNEGRDESGGRLEDLVLLSGDNALASALKPAEDGRGLIVRLHIYKRKEDPIELWLAKWKIKEALLCDGRERDLGPLELRDGKVMVPARRSIITVRLLI
ncbi:MAG: hypothetical protein R6V10_07125 [bacterium]